MSQRDAEERGRQRKWKENQRAVTLEKDSNYHFGFEDRGREP